MAPARHPTEHGEGREMLLTVVERSGGPAVAFAHDGLRVDDPRAVESTFWYRAVYALAAEEAHRRRFRDAEALARLVAVSLEKTLARRAVPFPKGRRRRRRALCAFLRELEPSALILLAGVSADHPDAATHPAAVPGALRRGGPVSPQALVTYVESRCQPLTPRAEYNLACYYAENKHLERARHLLRSSLPALDRAMQQWARRDHSLAAVRDTVDQILGTPPHAEP